MLNCNCCIAILENIWQCPKKAQAHLRMFSTKCVYKSYIKYIHGECPRGIMIKELDCGIVVSEFILQSHYYVHIRANTLGKGMNPLILPAMG